MAAEAHRPAAKTMALAAAALLLGKA